MFSSQSLGQHLLRGVVGGGLFYSAYFFGTSHTIFSLLLGVGGLVALRGCPMCWTIGLFNTLRRKIVREESLFHESSNMIDS
jgi:hypothetical protein